MLVDWNGVCVWKRSQKKKVRKKSPGDNIWRNCYLVFAHKIYPDSGKLTRIVNKTV